jgi:DNA-binding response OmpR family regulator
MPNLNGLQVLNNIYEMNPNQAIIIISAKDDSHYLIPLLNLGITYFFTKSIDYSLFIKTLSKICKKLSMDNQTKENNDIIKINDLLFWNKHKKELINNNKIIHLTKKEILLIERILKHRGRIYTVEELVLTIWNDDYMITDINIQNLKNLISRVRKKVPNIKIKNIYGLGYKLIY